MRPVRLLLDGFGCYRQPIEVDFSDVEFFALVGPTGSGKSTVIDGLCFSLYGTVPRWRDRAEIRQALAPAANSCKVSLIFEVAGKRYGVARALARNPRGQVTTRAARLDQLDPAIPASAPVGDMLEAVVESVAQGAPQVTAAVAEVLGLSYEHFIQSVLLPQGRFADFLQAEPRKRQDLLVELLAFGVYEQVGKLARQRADRAAIQREAAERARAPLAEATPEAEAVAAARIDVLSGLVGTAQERLEALAALRQQAQAAADEAGRVRTECALVAAVHRPDDVPDLARRIAEAERVVVERRVLCDDAEAAEAATQQARDTLGDKNALDRFALAHEQHRELTARLGAQEQELARRQADQAGAAAALGTAERDLEQARGDLSAAERSDMAAALATHLHIGEDCPVCGQQVAALPPRPASADLTGARAAVTVAERRLAAVREGQQQAFGLVASGASAAEATRAQLQTVAAGLADSPAEAEVLASLDAIALADQALSQARLAARTARAALTAAGNERSALGAAEQAARAGLVLARDSVVALGAPMLAAADLAADWDTLTGWAAKELEHRLARQPGLDGRAESALGEVRGAEAVLVSLLAEHGIDGSAETAAADVATHLERARNHLAAVRKNLADAARLDAEIAACREDEQVAAMLGNLLRANSFERWLCREALDSLVVEASATLIALSGGQYELHLDERNDLFVIDHQDAGAMRRVDTLSGGETFQASLALALALSKQVVDLSAGQREMNSMFLDEGFGTLDADTLETVGTTLERLADDSDRMIGVVTHVQALAERAPVRFVVSRTGTGATVHKERL